MFPRRCVIPTFWFNFLLWYNVLVRRFSLAYHAKHLKVDMTLCRPGYRLNCVLCKEPLPVPGITCWDRFPRQLGSIRCVRRNETRLVICFLILGVSSWSTWLHSCCCEQEQYFLECFSAESCHSKASEEHKSQVNHSENTFSNHWPFASGLELCLQWEYTYIWIPNRFTVLIAQEVLQNLPISIVSQPRIRSI